MTAAVLDTRPPGLDVPFRPGNTLAVSLTWPAGALDGRTFTATLGGAALTVDVTDDVMAVSASAAQTAAATVPATFRLTETTGGANDDVIVGTWKPSNNPSTGPATSVVVTESSGAVDVTLLPGGVTPAALDAETAARIAADTALGERVGTLEDARPHRVDWYGTAGWGLFGAPIVVTNEDNTVTLTGTTGVGTATGSVSGAGSDRRIYPLATVTAADVEARAVWSPGSGQLGWALRIDEAAGAAVVLWSNVTFGASANHLSGVWEWDPSGSGSQAAFRTNQGGSLNGFVLPVLSATGSGTTVTVQAPRPHFLAVGDLVGVTIPGGPPANNYTVASVPTATSFTFANATSGSWTGGTVSRVFSPPRCWSAVRLVGDRLTAKQWVVGEPEPDWGDSARTASFVLPATLAGSGAPPPASGGVGVIVAHLGPTHAVSLADLTFTILD